MTQRTSPMRNKMMIVAVLALATFSACKEKKPVMTVNEQAIQEKAMLDDGFKAAFVIKTGEDAPCDYQLQLTNSELLDPSEWRDDFKKGDLAVWVKYIGQRRQNRCGRNIPVEVTEIKLRVAK